MDLGSTNGTFINNDRLEPERYYELLEQVRGSFLPVSRDVFLSCGDHAEVVEQRWSSRVGRATAASSCQLANCSVGGGLIRVGCAQRHRPHASTRDACPVLPSSLPSGRHQIW